MFAESRGHRLGRGRLTQRAGWPVACALLLLLSLVFTACGRQLAGLNAPIVPTRVVEPTSGRVKEVWTTEPGVQIYSSSRSSP